MEVREHSRRALLIGLALLAVVAILASTTTSSFVHEALDTTKHWIVHYPRLGTIAFLVFAIASAILIFFSSAILVPVAIYAWGQPRTLLLLWVGWMIGGVISYLIGRYPGRKLLRWLTPARAARYEKKISANATFPLVLLFQLALPSEIPGYVLGAARYPFLKYFAARALAELPFAIGAVYLGRSFVEGRYFVFLLVGVAGLIFSVAMYRLLHARLEKQ